MNDPIATRLLSIGEIFDRAVNVVLRNFLQLSLAFGIFFIPSRALYDWVNRAQDEHFAFALGTAVANLRLLSQFFRLSADPTWKSTASGWAVVAFEIAANILAACVIANVTLRLLRGKGMVVFQVLRRSLRMWHRLVALQCTTLFLIVVPAIVAAAAMWAIWPIARSLGAILAVISVSAALLFCVFEAWRFCAFAAIALDDTPIIRAMRTAWRMTMSKAMVWRSFAFGFGIVSFGVAGLFLSSTSQGLTFNLTHQVLPVQILRDLLAIAISIFVNVAGIVFYLDAKARYAAIQDAAQNRENSAAR